METTRTVRCAALFALPGLLTLLLLAPTPARAQYEVTVYADGLVHPNGLDMDASGRLWVAEEGSGDVEPGVCGNDGRVSIITTGGAVFPFVENLPSCTVEGFQFGAHDVTFDSDGTLLIAQSGGSPLAA
jgi:secreted PhoX family phosphatase